jgi:hypothetical protein
MILRVFNLGRFAALLLCGLAFGALPASADGCGPYGCYQAAPVAAPPPVAMPVAPPPCCDQPCSGCSSSYYLGYYPAYTFPSCCGYGGYPGFGFGLGYGYGYDIGYRYGWGPRYGSGPREGWRRRDGWAAPHYVGPRIYSR